MYKWLFTFRRIYAWISSMLFNACDVRGVSFFWGYRHQYTISLICSLIQRNKILPFCELYIISCVLPYVPRFLLMHLHFRRFCLFSISWFSCRDNAKRDQQITKLGYWYDRNSDPKTHLSSNVTKKRLKLEPFT